MLFVRLIYHTFVVLLNPAALVTFNETVKLPPIIYVWTGFRRVALTILPSPNVQFQVVGEFTERSVNDTAIGAVPFLGVPMKSATGGFDAMTALYAFNLPPVATFPDRELFTSTVERMIFFICADVREGFTAFTSAATPETWGVAMDVPLMVT